MCRAACLVVLAASGGALRTSPPHMRLRRAQQKLRVSLARAQRKGVLPKVAEGWAEGCETEEEQECAPRPSGRVTRSLRKGGLPGRPFVEEVVGPAQVWAELPLLLRSCDAALAGVGLAGSVAALGWLEAELGVDLFVPPMLASGIIFFAGPRPPDPAGFLSGTACSATLSAAVLVLAARAGLPEVAAQGAAAGCLLGWYRWYGRIFPPAAALAGLLASTFAYPAGDEALSSGVASAASFVCFPWLAGHAFLYVSAASLSPVRTAARLALTRRRIERLGERSDAELRRLFDRFDVSGDQRLRPEELRLALRATLGAELDPADVADLVGAADKTGDGAVDFDEFVDICRVEGVDS